MKPIVLGAALALLSGCVTYERHAYAPPLGGSHAAQAPSLLTEDQAVEIAFRLCQDRTLRVDRVERARLDDAGRWHVTLAGLGDRAQVLLDGHDGKLLKGRFRRDDSAPPDGPSSQPPSAPPPPKAEPEPLPDLD